MLSRNEINGFLCVAVIVVASVLACLALYHRTAHIGGGSCPIPSSTSALKR